MLETVIVGCGAVAQRLYRKPLQRLEQAGTLRVSALVDPADSHAAALQAVFRGASIFRTLDDALNATRPALTLILTPPHLHCTQVLKAFERGSHILCEKPMANTAAECAQMTAAAEKAQRVLAVGMIRRFFPAFAQLKDLLEAGGLGALTAFEYREGRKFEWEVTTPAMFRPRAQGGAGVLFDIGPHVADHLAWTFGELQVTSYADNALAGVESNLAMDVSSSRCTGSIHLSWDDPQPNELRVFGADGEAVLRIDRFDQFAVRRSSKYEPQRVTASFAADTRPVPQRRLSPRSYPDAVYCQLVQMVRAITLGEPPAVDGESGSRTIAVLESALPLARPLPMPWLEPDEQQAYAHLHWNSRG